jgi:Spy/CpxP family protein refolding chaperone
MMGTSIKKLLGIVLTAALFLGSLGVAKAQEAPQASGAEKILQIKEKLGLSDEQVAKLKTMVQSEKAELAPMVKQQLADLKTLGEKVKANAPDAELSPILDKMEARRQNIESVKSKYIGEARTILTPTQQAKVVLGVAMWKGAALKKLGQKWRNK